MQLKIEIIYLKHLMLGNKYVTFISANFYHEGEGGH